MLTTGGGVKLQAQQALTCLCLFVCPANGSTLIVRLQEICSLSLPSQVSFDNLCARYYNCSKTADDDIICTTLYVLSCWMPSSLLVRHHHHQLLDCNKSAEKPSHLSFQHFLGTNRLLLALSCSLPLFPLLHSVTKSVDLIIAIIILIIIRHQQQQVDQVMLDGHISTTQSFGRFPKIESLFSALPSPSPSPVSGHRQCSIFCTLLVHFALPLHHHHHHHSGACQLSAEAIMIYRWPSVCVRVFLFLLLCTSVYTKRRLTDRQKQQHQHQFVSSAHTQIRAAILWKSSQKGCN